MRETALQPPPPTPTTLIGGSPSNSRLLFIGPPCPRERRVFLEAGSYLPWFVASAPAKAGPRDCQRWTSRQRSLPLLREQDLEPVAQLLEQPVERARPCPAMERQRRLLGSHGPLKKADARRVGGVEKLVDEPEDTAWHADPRRHARDLLGQEVDPRQARPAAP